MIVLGIVGTPAGGKSTVAQRLAELGATWINADLIARSVLERSEVQDNLTKRYGAEIVDKHGTIDRPKLASLVFGDDDASRLRLEYLEELIHPATRKLITEQLISSEEKGDAVAILDVPLLFKSSWDRSCDEIWCVDADADRRIERVKTRGWTAPQLQAREKNQLDILEKKRLSTRIILNNGTRSELNETISSFWSSLVKRHTFAIDPKHCLQRSQSALMKGKF
ncbi:dephospho-CoA kinase [Rhodopirellula sp.]|nr:dephospho-CoA kinase [Rhodopirellula sp.]MDA7907103.1 dephospho-CoA kinase [bacterium]